MEQEVPTIIPFIGKIATSRTNNKTDVGRWEGYTVSINKGKNSWKGKIKGGNNSENRNGKQFIINFVISSP